MAMSMGDKFPDQTIELLQLKIGSIREYRASGRISSNIHLLILRLADGRIGLAVTKKICAVITYRLQQSVRFLLVFSSF